MATVVLTTLGRAVGGPIGSAVGALVGRTIDGAVFGSRTRQGPRLRELQGFIARGHRQLARPGFVAKSMGTLPARMNTIVGSSVWSNAYVPIMRGLPPDESATASVVIVG